MINWHQSLVYLTLSYKIRLSISLHVFSIEHHIMYQLTSQIEFIVQHLNKIAVGQYLLQNSLSTFNLPLDSGDKSVWVRKPLQSFEGATIMDCDGSHYGRHSNDGSHGVDCERQY